MGFGEGREAQGAVSMGIPSDKRNIWEGEGKRHLGAQLQVPGWIQL